MEFDGFTPKKEWLDEVDLVVQVGDLHHAPNNVKILKTWNAPVLFVPGNHDFWNTDVRMISGAPYAWGNGEASYFVKCDRTWGQASKEMQSEAAMSDSAVCVLDNNTIILNGVRFIGSTLWYKALDLTGWEVALINDYRRIFNEDRQLITPAWVHERHEESVAYINSELNKPFDGKTVLLTHHPAWIAPGLDDKQCPKAYGTDLESLWSGRVDLMVHGHFHTPVDTVVNGTRIICNPRGYPSEDTRRTFKKNFIVEI